MHLKYQNTCFPVVSLNVKWKIVTGQTKITVLLSFGTCYNFYYH